jgi:hypothetical protein
MERAQHAKEQIEYMTDKIPIKCCGTLAEFADMAVFFVSPGQRVHDRLHLRSERRPLH